eukprot:TRINITY_DN6763_c0_g1_i1.p1 TRINITY_DN6763_c0_g1~~TRINITY_DN6763_c0_g1_i1.p1  ORF type:complete len:185 (-),score=24.86 TRINITY_DN6763_c0_g1_i1:37-591(-)
MNNKREQIAVIDRKIDIAIMGYFVINIILVSYCVDIEQLFIPSYYEWIAEDPIQYPVWPPKICVDLIHWWSNNFDPVIIERPVWWKVTIWWDALLFGPFYFIALYCFWKGNEKIRMPSIMYSCFLMVIMTVILSEEIWGANATPHMWLVLLVNGPWAVFPIVILTRMLLDEHPFTRLVSKSKNN